MPGLRRSDVVDAAVALVACGLAVVAVLVVDDAGAGDRRALGVALMCTLTLPLVVRRRAPLTVASIVGIASAIVWASKVVDGPTAIIGPIALYTLGRHATPPRSYVVMAGLAAVLTGTGAVLAIRAGTGEAWFGLLSRLSIAAAPFWLGESLRTRTELAESFRARAEQAERERTAEARRAVQEERARITRELHDVVGHSVSVMVVQSAVADRLASSDPDRAREAIRRVAEMARSTMSEMRRAVDVLGSADEELAGFAPQPTLADIDQVVQRCRDAGLTVRVERTGALPPLAPGAELSLFRIVQEACTNVLKHARASTVDVRLIVGGAYDAIAALDLVVEDDGVAAMPAMPAPGSGRGLIGMRERVQAWQGTLEVGPRASGGYRVAAHFPLDAIAVTRAPA